MPHRPSPNTPDLTWWREAILLRRRLVALKAQTRLLRHDLRRKYDPGQPRVPAGNPDGGQWTSDAGAGGATPDWLGVLDGILSSASAMVSIPGEVVADVGGTETWAFYQDSTRPDGSLAERAVVNRDGSTIHSEFAEPGKASDWDERHTVTLTEGEKTTFETADRTQTIRAGGPDGEVVSRTTWTERGPEPEATVQLALAPLLPAVPAAVEATITTGLMLFTWLSARNKLDGLQAVVGFKAREFQANESTPPTLDFVANLTEQEVDRVCRRRETVQKFLDDAVEQAGPPDNYPNRGAYGSDVHLRVKRRVDDANDVDFRAEISAFREGTDGDGERRYGLKNTLRADVAEKVDETTVCGYDIKTGNATLTPRRAAELVAMMMRLHPHARRFLIMQMKPSR